LEIGSLVSTRSGKVIPRGYELAVWLKPHSNATKLINKLAGMFCGSLNHLNLIKDVPLELFNTTFSDQHFHQSFYHNLLHIEQPCTQKFKPFVQIIALWPASRSLFLDQCASVG
jgi:hypothetical protein